MKKFDLGKIEKVDIRNIWEHEGTEFTPWLAKEENIELLGSANIVTNTSDGSAVWTYDKVSSEAKDGSAMGAGVVPGGRFLGIFGGSRSSKSNKNLTLTIRFTPEGLVDSFKYQSIKY